MLPTPIQNQAAQTPQDNSVNQQRQQKGTGFTNIDKILGANQGAGQKEGQALGAGLTGQADQVRAGIESSQNQFNQQAGTAKANANNAIQAGQQYARNAGETDDAYAQRVSGAQGDLTQTGQNLANASYTGPTALKNADQINQQATNVSALGRLAGNTAGQQQLLRNFVASKGNYSLGQNALDSLLLGQGGQQYVQQGRTAANQVGQMAGNATANAQAQAQAAQAAINTNKTNALQALQNSLNGTGDSTSNGILGLNTLATNQATEYTKNAQRLQQLLSGKDANGNPLTGANITDADKALLQHASDYGLNNTIYSAGGGYLKTPDTTNWRPEAFANYNNYTVNPINNALNQLSSNITTQGLGNQLFTDPQRAAALNLTKLLGDTQSQDQISNAQFNKNIIDQNNQKTVLNSLDPNQQYLNDQSLHNAYDKLKQYGDPTTGKINGGDFNTWQNLKNQTGLSDPELQKLVSQSNLYNSSVNNEKTGQVNLSDVILKRIMGQG